MLARTCLPLQKWALEVRFTAQLETKPISLSLLAVPFANTLRVMELPRPPCSYFALLPDELLIVILEFAMNSEAKGPYQRASVCRAVVLTCKRWVSPQFDAKSLSYNFEQYNCGLNLFYKAIYVGHKWELRKLLSTLQANRSLASAVLTLRVEIHMPPRLGAQMSLTFKCMFGTLFSQLK